MKKSIEIGFLVEVQATNDFQSIKYNIGSEFRVKALCDVGSDNAIYVSEDLVTWFHPIDLKVVDTHTDGIRDDYKEGLNCDS